jgi:hypothetical protein
VCEQVHIGTRFCAGAAELIPPGAWQFDGSTSGVRANARPQADAGEAARRPAMQFHLDAIAPVGLSVPAPSCSAARARRHNATLTDTKTARRPTLSAHRPAFGETAHLIKSDLQATLFAADGGKFSSDVAIAVPAASPSEEG